MDQNLTVVQITLIIVGIIFALYVIQYATSENKSLERFSQNNPPQTVAKTVSDIKPSTQIKPNAKFTLFNFYSPYCPYSRDFNVIWDQLSSKLGNIPDLNMKAINSTDSENENLSFYYGVEHSPTIIFTSSSKKENYEGPRDIESITQYILTKMRE